VMATSADGLAEPRDLEFNPDDPETLWIVNRDNDGMVILFDAGTEAQTSELRIDVYGNHFMEEVSSIAFGATGTFATCQESRNTYDDMHPHNDFMGPALWSSDLDIFGVVNQNNNLLGSHIDMLHESPYCMGVAHHEDNAYWAFDGHHGHLVYYDFQVDHGPGYDDHSDGIVRRYTEIELSRVPGTPGHLTEDGHGNLFIVDTGAQRVVKLDTDSGEHGEDLPLEQEPLEEYATWVDVDFEVFAENIGRPSGIWTNGDRVLVSDNLNGTILAYDADGEEIGRLETEAESLQGMTVAPDGALWFVDASANEVIRVRAD